MTYQQGPYGQPQYGQPTYPPPPPPKKGLGVWAWIAIVIVGLIAVGGISELLTKESDSSPPVTNAAPTQIEAPAPTPVDPLTSDGVYKVGVDIAPGVYRYVVRDSGYFARCGNANCDDIIDNDLMSDGTGYIEIEPTDAYVEIKGLNLTPDS